MKIYNLTFLLFIGAACVTQFAADIYAPCMPAISKDMGTSVNYVQWSMSVYMFGVAITQLIYGPISEGIGRKKPIAVGLFIMTIGGIICLIAKDINTLIIGRLIQGIGAGAPAALWRAVFRDSFSGEELAKYASYLIIFVMFIIPTAPLIGGYLEESFGWESSFVFITIYSLLGFVGIVLTFKETNQHVHISKLNLSYIFRQYIVLLKNPIFTGTTLSTFLSYGAFFAWFVAGPVLLIEKLGIQPSEFGLFTFFGGGGALGISGFLNGKLVKKFGIKSMLRFGWSVMIISGISMVLGYYIIGLNILAITIPAGLFYSGSTFIWPNAVATAFTPFGHMAGYAGAMYGCMQICGGGAIAAIIAYLPDDNQLPLGLVMVAASSVAWFIYEVATTERNRP